MQNVSLRIVSMKEKKIFLEVFFLFMEKFVYTVWIKRVNLLILTIPLFNLQHYLYTVLIILNVGYFIISITIVLSILSLTLFIDE